MVSIRQITQHDLEAFFDALQEHVRYSDQHKKSEVVVMLKITLAGLKPLRRGGAGSVLALHLLYASNTTMRCQIIHTPLV